jgi:hypothetical protein
LPSRAPSTRCRPAATAELAQALRHALDPVAFAVDRLGFQPDDWQVAFLRSAAPRVLLNITRQGGKSTTSAILALHTALYRPSSLILLVSPSLRQSSELFRKVTEFRSRLDPPPVLLENNALSCRLDNNSRIVCLPGDETTVRGFSAPALIIEDEAARVEDQLFRAVTPMLATTATGRLILMSTPRGRVGHYWEAWSQGEGWERIAIPATQVARIAPAFLEAERKALGDLWFRQEYACEFLQGADQLFSAADVARAISSSLEPLFPVTPDADDVVPLFAGGRGR